MERLFFALPSFQTGQAGQKQPCKDEAKKCHGEGGQLTHDNLAGNVEEV